MKRLVCIALFCVALDAAQVKQWDRFETPVTNTKKYADPYRDVQLLVTYRKPAGTEVKFWGFHDGGNTWRIRFMPDAPGKWQYDARFSDGQPGVRGTFDVVKSDLPGMISQYAPNPI